jgi:ankyrin repeat protein
MGQFPSVANTKSSQLKSNINSDVVRLLLEGGVDVNASNVKGQTALHFSLQRESAEIAAMQREAGAE